MSINNGHVKTIIRIFTHDRPLCIRTYVFDINLCKNDNGYQTAAKSMDQRAVKKRETKGIFHRCQPDVNTPPFEQQRTMAIVHNYAISTDGDINNNNHNRSF